MTKTELQEKLNKKFLQPFRSLLIIEGISILLSPIIIVWFSFMLFIKILITIFVITLPTLAAYKLFEYSIKVVMDRYKDDEKITKENWVNKTL